MPTLFPDFPKVDKNWTLFLDRDGVINTRIENDYVKRWDEFEFCPGSLDALKVLANVFGRIVVVTNQAGIGKGIYSEKILLSIHEKMLAVVGRTGGRIDKVYYCAHTKEANCACRKPFSGMAIQAKNDFSDIDFSKTIMVGDSVSDIIFGNNLGMFTVLIAGKKEEKEQHNTPIFDFYANSLNDFTFIISSNKSH